MTRDPEAVLADLRERFEYKSDGARDTWQLPADAGGAVVGDCEDHAIKLAFGLAGGSWVRFWWHQITLKSVIWHVTSTNGNGHAVLWHRGAGWACNMVPYWRRRTPHTRRFPYPFPLVALEFLLARTLF